jgi:hypothetical protein
MNCMTVVWTPGDIVVAITLWIIVAAVALRSGGAK